MAFWFPKYLSTIHVGLLDKSFPVCLIILIYHNLFLKPGGLFAIHCVWVLNFITKGLFVTLISEITLKVVNQ